MGKAADEADLGLGIYQELVFGPVVSGACYTHTELEMRNRQLDIVSGVPKAASRFIYSLGRLNRTQLWVTANAYKAQPAMERMPETDWRKPGSVFQAKSPLPVQSHWTCIILQAAHCDNVGNVYQKSSLESQGPRLLLGFSHIGTLCRE